MPTTAIKISSPLGGINRVVSRSGQSSTECWDALNVLPYDKYGRARIAQRFGVVKHYSTPIGIP